MRKAGQGERKTKGSFLRSRNKTTQKTREKDIPNKHQVPHLENEKIAQQPENLQQFQKFAQKQMQGIQINPS